MALSSAILAGCSGMGPARYKPPKELIAWDGLGRSPDDARPRAPRKLIRPAAVEASIEPDYSAIDASDVVPHSSEWWALREQADRVADAALSKRLVICRGCFPAQSKDDETGSITH